MKKTIKLFKILTMVLLIPVLIAFLTVAALDLAHTIRVLSDVIINDDHYTFGMAVGDLVNAFHNDFVSGIGLLAIALIFTVNLRGVEKTRDRILFALGCLGIFATRLIPAVISLTYQLFSLLKALILDGSSGFMSSLASALNLSPLIEIFLMLAFCFCALDALLRFRLSIVSAVYSGIVGIVQGLGNLFALSIVFLAMFESVILHDTLFYAAYNGLNILSVIDIISYTFVFFALALFSISRFFERRSARIAAECEEIEAERRAAENAEDAEDAEDAEASPESV